MNWTRFFAAQRCARAGVVAGQALVDGVPGLRIGRGLEAVDGAIDPGGHRVLLLLGEAAHDRRGRRRDGGAAVRAAGRQVAAQVGVEGVGLGLHRGAAAGGVGVDRRLVGAQARGVGGELLFVQRDQRAAAGLDLVQPLAGAGDAVLIEQRAAATR